MSRSAVEIREVSPGDIDALVAGMRQPDLDELDACGHAPEWAVQESVRRSSLCWTGLIDGEVAAIFGVAPLSLLGGIGAPWLLGTDLLDRHPRALIRHTLPYLAVMQAAYPHLVNFVDARNTRSIRWLKALGFTFQPALPHGPRGFAFHRFEMRA